MGVIKRGILGGFSGKVANVIGSSWKGIAVMKSMPLSVANPQTAGQVLQRTKMANIVFVAKELLANVVKPLNDRFAQEMSGFNLFVKNNILGFAVWPSPADVGFVLSEGKLDKVTITGQVANRTLNTIVMNWTDNSGVGFALPTDEVYVVGTSVNKTTLAVSTTAIRSDATVSVDMPADWIAGVNCNMSLALRRADGTIVSGTLNSGSVIAV